MSENPKQPSPTGLERSRLSRTLRAVRSGIRRYPKAIYQTVKPQSGVGRSFGSEQRTLPDLLSGLAAHELAVAWLGHATVAAQFDQTSLVVDPVLSPSIGVRVGKRTIGVPRIGPVPITPDRLVGTDLVLITHAHFDHLDKPTLRGMASQRTVAVVPWRCSSLVPTGFGDVIELRPGRSLSIANITIRAIAPRHWGARAVLDRRRGNNAYLVRSASGSVLFAGDTAATHAFDGLEDLDLAAFGIGAYDPWDHMHATPEQIWNMYRRLEASYLLPIHHSTFELSDEPMDEPMRRLLRTAGVDRDRVLDVGVGDIVRLGRGERG